MQIWIRSRATLAPMCKRTSVDQCSTLKPIIELVPVKLLTVPSTRNMLRASIVNRVFDYTRDTQTNYLIGYLSVFISNFYLSSHRNRAPSTIEILATETKQNKIKPKKEKKQRQRSDFSSFMKNRKARRMRRRDNWKEYPIMKLRRKVTVVFWCQNNGSQPRQPRVCQSSSLPSMPDTIPQFYCFAFISRPSWYHRHVDIRAWNSRLLNGERRI